MSSFAIKIIAIISMTIDHIGCHLVINPISYFICRSLGRIAFPLFCFSMANSFRHTSNKVAYLKRLAVFALLLEFGLYIIYLFTNINYMFSVNIFLTLTSCLLSLILFDSKINFFQIIGLLFIIIVSFTRLDYGIYGIFLVLIFYYVPTFKHQLTFSLILNAIFIHISPYIFMNPMLHFSLIQWFSLLAFIPIYYYNKMQGKKLKYFFYLYYPLSTLVIWLISYYL